MEKTTGNEYFYVLTCLLVGFPTAAFSESQTNELTQIAPRIAAPPVVEMDISSWLEEAREEAFSGFRAQWQAEARQIVQGFGHYDPNLALDPQLGRKLAEEAKETLAVTLANQEVPIAIKPEVESLAAN